MKPAQSLRRMIFQAAVALLTISAAPLCSAFYICFSDRYPYSDIACRSAPTVQVYEYLNENTRRRVLLNDPVELDIVDRGLAGPGWRRTSTTLSMLAPDYNQSYAKQLVDICRFYAPSVNSHFFNSNALECELLKQPGTGWIFERVAFKADPPVDGVCPSWSSIPVYRYYNNRAAFGDTTHRYSPDRSLKARLEAEGWIDEGIGFCAMGWWESPVVTYAMNSNRVAETAVCENEGVALGCVAVNQQAPMSRVIVVAEQTCRSLTDSPFFRRTGTCNLAVHTAQTAVSHEEIAAHSFAQLAGPGSTFSPFSGIYVNSRDINSTEILATSVNPIYQFVTAPPLYPGAADLRVMPWKDGVAQDIDISFDLTVKTLLRRTNGHAIAHPVIELIDTKSRHNFYITIGTVSGEPQADFAARDFGVGKPIISTLFRDDPAFGVRLSGNTFLCNTDNLDTGCAQAGNNSFHFRLRPADIAGVVARARKLDSALSANIADYAIDNFSFNTEVSGDAEIGLRLSNYRLDLYLH